MFNKKEAEQLLMCMDVAIKQSQDSFAAAAELAPVREKLTQSLKDEDGDNEK